MMFLFIWVVVGLFAKMSIGADLYPTACLSLFITFLITDMFEKEKKPLDEKMILEHQQLVERYQKEIAERIEKRGF